MFTKLKALVTQECLLDPELPLILGVSGGPDSLTMLHALHQLGFRLIVAHVNHGFRDSASLEAQIVAGYAQSLGLLCEVEAVNIRSYADVQGLSLEEAARNIRYEFLFRIACKFNAQAVAVGHTADDQVETFLMHLLRGAGLSGLKGMEYRSVPNTWSQEIPLVRPLLAFWRDEISGYCQEHNLKPVYDESNLDTTYFRNRLRHELIPYLQGYNLRVKEGILRTTRVLASDYRIIKSITDNAWEDCLVDCGDGYTSFSMPRLFQQPLGIQRNMLRRAVASQRPDLRDIYFDVTEKALSFLATPSKSGHCDLALGLRLEIEGDLLWLAAWQTELPTAVWPQLHSNTDIVLNVPGEVDLGFGWVLTMEIGGEVEKLSERVSGNTDPYQAWLDGDELVLPLTVRARHAGDHFRPMGMGGQWVKLNEFLIGQKMPRRARSAWPLVCAGEEIIWIPGYRMSEGYKLNRESKNIISMQLRRRES